MLLRASVLVSVPLSSPNDQLEGLHNLVGLDHLPITHLEPAQEAGVDLLEGTAAPP